MIFRLGDEYCNPIRNNLWRNVKSKQNFSNYAHVSKWVRFKNSYKRYWMPNHLELANKELKWPNAVHDVYVCVCVPVSVWESAAFVCTLDRSAISMKIQVLNCIHIWSFLRSFVRSLFRIRNWNQAIKSENEKTDRHISRKRNKNR